MNKTFKQLQNVTFVKKTFLRKTKGLEIIVTLQENTEGRHIMNVIETSDLLIRYQ